MIKKVSFENQTRLIVRYVTRLINNLIQIINRTFQLYFETLQRRGE